MLGFGVALLCNLSVTVTVGLISDKTVTVEAGLDEDVKIVKRRAQTALGVGQGRLLDSSGKVLDDGVPFKKAREQTADSFTLHTSRVQVQRASGCHSTFTALLGDGSALSWGYARAGGDSSAVQDQLKDVQQIQATKAAFAAIRGDGSVVTWRRDTFGDNSSAVQAQLKNVQQIHACGCALAAILGDGSVVSWPPANVLFDSNTVQHRLNMSSKPKPLVAAPLLPLYAMDLS